MMTGYYSRDIGGLVSKALSEMPVVVVTGMRQTGKTTLLQRQPGLRDRRYVTFDDFAQLEPEPRPIRTGSSRRTNPLR